MIPADAHPGWYLAGFAIAVAVIFVWAWFDAADCRRDEERRRQHRALARRPMRGGLR